MNIRRQFVYRAIALLKFPVRVFRIGRIIRKPSYYPEMLRKSKLEMWQDNFRWLCKHHEMNSHYTSYGLDVKNFRDADEYLAIKEFNLERDIGNASRKTSFYGNSYNYILILRDKYVFSAFFDSTLGPGATAKTLGLINGGRVYLYDERRWVAFSEYTNDEKTVVFKALDGTFGDGVNLVRINRGKITVSEKNYTADEYYHIIGKSKILIQEPLTQHESLQAFGSGCINTIRAVTVRGQSGTISVFAAFLRVGADSSSFVDNRAKGGLGVGIELDTGKLMKFGFQHEKFGEKYDKHPLSGIRFEGYQLPYWREICQLVCDAHRQLPELQSIGWDVVITPNGPLLLEGNDCWEISGPQDTYGGLRKRWNQLRE